MANERLAPIPSPARPVQPTWAESSGIVPFLAAALQKTQYDYQQREAMRQKQAEWQADLSKTMQYLAGQKDIAKMQQRGQMATDMYKSTVQYGGDVNAVLKMFPEFFGEMTEAPMDLPTQLKKAMEESKDKADLKKRLAVILTPENDPGGIRFAQILNAWTPTKKAEMPKTTTPPPYDVNAPLVQAGQAVGGFMRPALPYIAPVMQGLAPAIPGMAPNVQQTPGYQAGQYIGKEVLPWIGKGIGQFMYGLQQPTAQE